MARLPQTARLAALPPPEQYAAAELFRGTMLRHSVVVYRNDSENVLRQVSFAGAAWPDYVPIRMPETMAVEERLPEGAAAVLINQGHTCTDIYLPIDAQEKRLFDAIDGKRTIRTHGHLEAARALFERLYWHDQVAFDAHEES
jgi:hypothetical protein